MPRVVKFDDPVVVAMRQTSTSGCPFGWCRDDQMAEAMKGIVTVAGVGASAGINRSESI